MTYFAPDVLTTEQMGGQLAICCECQSVLYLLGEMGVGKTTFVRGFLKALGYTGTVRSPTYTLLEPYPLTNLTVYHLDLYRISDPEELEYLGLRDYLATDMICLIEWPHQGRGLIPMADLEIHLAYHHQGRCLSLRPCNERGKNIVKQVKTVFMRYENC
jgi:tRNA threonylcarbamoyladenosine biosynthesis protein TsaE